MPDSKKWLIFSIVKEYSFNFSTLNDENYPIKHWHKFDDFNFNYDIFLISNIRNGEYRFGKPIPELENYLMEPSHSLLGICCVIEATNEIEARKKGKAFVESFLNTVNVSSGIGFEIIPNQLFVESVPKDYNSGENFEFETKYGKDTISFQIGNRTTNHYYNYRISLQSKEKNMFPVISIVPTPGINVKTSLIDIDEFKDIASKNLKSFMNLEIDDKNKFIISSKLFRQSALTEDIIISFLLLWMSLETISKQEHGKYLEKDDVDEIIDLITEKYGTDEIDRLRSTFSNIHKKGKRSLLSNFISNNSEFEYDEIFKEIKGLSDIRGDIVHPKKSIEDKIILESYNKLFNIVDKILKTILKNGCIMRSEQVGEGQRRNARLGEEEGKKAHNP